MVCLKKVNAINSWHGGEFDLSIFYEFDLLIFSIFKKDRIALVDLLKRLKERIDPVDLKKISTGAIKSFSRSNRSFYHKNDRFDRNTDDRITNPDSWLNSDIEPCIAHISGRNIEL